MTDDQRREIIRLQAVWDAYNATYALQGRDKSYYAKVRSRLRTEFGEYVRGCLDFYRPTQIADRIKDRERWAREKAH